MLSPAPTNTCRCPFSNSSLQIPSTNYTHTMNLASPEATPGADVKVITVELQVQEWYKLYVEPTRGCRKLTMENEDYLVSPKFTCKFKVPVFLSNSESRCGPYVNRELDKLPVSRSLAQYVKPFIVNSVVEFVLANFTEFKVVFHVRVVKIDLANHHECEYYRRRGLV